MKHKMRFVQVKWLFGLTACTNLHRPENVLCFIWESIFLNETNLIHKGRDVHRVRNASDNYFHPFHTRKMLMFQLHFLMWYFPKTCQIRGPVIISPETMAVHSYQDE